jgi:hypothetical protein
LRRAILAQRCRRVMSNSDTCGCPALREQQYCRFHGQAYEEEIELPVIEDVDSLQIAYISLAKRIATGKIAAAEAKLLLQVAKSPKWRGSKLDSSLTSSYSSSFSLGNQ